jgi:DNA-binding PucR family transcriptional regulator
MADSHDDARVARRAAELFELGARGPIGYRTAGLLSLLSRDPAEAIRFAETELGELADDGDAAARLRATLRVYLEENLSPARTARRLGIHHNTVIYRVKQAAETLGRPIEVRRLPLEVALRIADRLDALRTARDRSRRAQLRERS